MQVRRDTRTILAMSAFSLVFGCSEPAPTNPGMDADVDDATVDATSLSDGALNDGALTDGALDGGPDGSASESGAERWRHSYPGAFNHVSAVLSLRDGGVIVAARFTGTVRFGGDEIDVGFVLTRFDAHGEHVWSLPLANTLFAYVAEAADGHLWVAGEGWPDLGDGAGPPPPDGSPASFIGKLGADGSHVWSTFTVGRHQISSVAVAPNGTGAIGGTVSEEVSIAGRTLQPISSECCRSAFVLGLDAHGEPTFDRVFLQSQPAVRHVVFDDSGRLLVQGYADRAGVIDESTFDPAGGTADVFVMRWSATSSPEWLRQIGNDDHNFSFTFDANGNAESVIAGDYASELRIDEASLAVTGGVESYVIGLDTAGHVRFATALTGDGTERVTGVAASPDGRTAIIGEFEGSARLGTHVFEGSASGPGAVVAVLDGTGRVVWAHMLPEYTTGRVDAGTTTMHVAAIDRSSSALLVAGFAL